MSNLSCFKYKALDSEQAIHAGYLYGTSTQQVIKTLIALKLTPISLKKTPLWLRKLINLPKLLLKSHRVNQQFRMILYSQLGSMLQANFPLIDALQSAKDCCLQLKTKVGLQKVIEDVMAGFPLCDSFARYLPFIPQGELNVLAASEQAGHIDKSLVALANYLKNQVLVKGAMLIWALPLIFFNLLTFYLCNYLANTMVDFYAFQLEMLAIPEPASVTLFRLIYAGNFLVSICVALFIFFSVKYTDSFLNRYLDFYYRGRCWLLAHLPLIGDGRRLTELSNFCNILALSLEAKINLSDAIDNAILSVIDTYYIGELKQLSNKLREGYNPVHLFSNLKLFSASDVFLIKNALQSNTLEESVDTMLEFSRLRLQMRRAIQTNVVRFSLIGVLLCQILFCASSILKQVFLAYGY